MSSQNINVSFLNLEKVTISGTVNLLLTIRLIIRLITGALCIFINSVKILTKGSSGCLLRPTILTASVLSLVGIINSGGSGFDGCSFRLTTASCVSRSAFRCELLSNRTSSRAFSSLEERSAWHTSSTMSQMDEHTGSTWSGGSSRRSWTCNSHDGC